MFVIDLERLCGKATVVVEAGELCQWMQMVFSGARDPDELHPIIVGTRRNLSTADVE